MRSENCNFENKGRLFQLKYVAGRKAAFIEFLLYDFISIVAFNPNINSKMWIVLNLHMRKWKLQKLL